jgi:hypothetical protein
MMTMTRAIVLFFCFSVLFFSARAACGPAGATGITCSQSIVGSALISDWVAVCYLPVFEEGSTRGRSRGEIEGRRSSSQKEEKQDIIQT